MNGKLLIVASVVAVTASFAGRAHAFSGGAASTAWTATPAAGCNMCHSGGAAPTTSFRTTAGTAVTTLSVDRASTVDLILRIAGGQTNGSFNVSPSAGDTVGTLKVSTDTGVKTVMAGTTTELTHTAARAYTSGAADFRFTFDPNDTVACGTTVTLTGWGLSSNGTAATAGDLADMETLAITITCGGTDAGTDAATDAATDTGTAVTDTGTTVTDTGAADDTGVVADTGTAVTDTGTAADTGAVADTGTEPVAPAEEDDGCDCSTPGSGAASTTSTGLALAALAFVAVRRVRRKR